MSQLRTGLSLIERAIIARSDFFAPRHDAAFRLFNGFLEGYPELVLDLYGRTLVVHNYAEDWQSERAEFQAALPEFLAWLPHVYTVLLKSRGAPDPALRNGEIIHGSQLDRRIREHGVAYALDLALNRDASFYLDTRNVRAWALANLRGARVLNTFAYTGSLGVAALAAGATQVVQLDLNREFLNLAKTSCTLNGLPIVRGDFRSSDFFTEVGRMRKQGEQFDCVFLDPPFFSVTRSGRVDLVGESVRLINKVRPLISDGGYLVAINNALFLSGADYLAALHSLGADGYMQVEDRIEVPADCAGMPQTRIRALPSDPAPFNHSTKIAVLRIRKRTA